MRTFIRERRVPGGYWEDVYDVVMLWGLTTKLGLDYRPMTDFAHSFKDDCWSEENAQGKEVFVSPRAVLQNPQLHVSHMTKIKEAKLKYPILVTATIVLEVIDGMHRLCKAELENWQMMPVKFVDSEILERALVSSQFYATL
jgi:hypothetical protein